MVTVTEQIAREMKPIPENDERLSTAVQVDRLFDTFEIAMSPDEALAFAKTVAIGSRFVPLIEKINSLMPPAQRGLMAQPSHHFRVGREYGVRIIKTDIFKGFFAPDYDMTAFLEIVRTIGANAGAEIDMNYDNNSYLISMRLTASE